MTYLVPNILTNKCKTRELLNLFRDFALMLNVSGVSLV